MAALVMDFRAYELTCRDAAGAIREQLVAQSFCQRSARPAAAIRQILTWPLSTRLQACVDRILSR